MGPLKDACHFKSLESAFPLSLLLIKGPVNVNKFSFGKVLLGIEKIVKIFLISDKIFPKLVYYCVPVGHTLVKSFNKIAIIGHTIFFNLVIIAGPLKINLIISCVWCSICLNLY